MERISFSSRILAALIDYIIVIVAVIPFWSLVSSPDYQYVATIFVALTYYTIGNSTLLNGQTIGKRLFGLRVYRCGGQGELLSPIEAALRYFATFGVLILGTEIPPLIFREFQFIGSPTILEIPMLFVVVYLASNIFCFLLDPQQRALHDIFINSHVVRGNPQGGTDLPSHEPKIYQYLYFRILIGLLIGMLFWSASLHHHPAVSEIARVRYFIEGNLPVRLYSVGALPYIPESEPTREEADLMRLEILVLPLVKIDNEDLLSEQILQLALTHSKLGEHRLKSVLFRWLDPLNTPESERRAELSTIEIPMFKAPKPEILQP